MGDVDQHWWPALRARAAARPRTVDAILAALVYVALTLGVSTAAKVDGPWWLAPVCNLAPAVPLVWRRVAPVPALAASLAGALVVILAVGPTGGEPATMVALATVVSREPSARRAGAAAALVVAGILLVVAFAATGEDSALVNGLSAWVVAVAAGVAGRARRAELAREAELAVAAERTRLARDVHDVVSHNVAVMVALSAGVEQTAERDPAAARVAAGQAATVGREALTELRGLLGVLRDVPPPPATATAPAGGAARGSDEREPQPGVADLGALAERARLAGLDAALHVDADGVAPLVGLTVFRIAQEAVTNVLRHAAGATRVAIDVRADGDAVGLTVVDDGAAPPAPRPGGRGLVGMRERVALHRGSVEAGPRPEGGWRVEARIPR